MQEINELKNLVIQSLEGNGVLGQIRAQIRASVFKIIEMQEANQKKNSGFFWENPHCQSIYDHSEGKLALELINDFLEFFKMDYTMSVFSHESNLKDAAKRDELLKNLGIKGDNTKPVLFQIINALKSQTATNKENQNVSSISKDTSIRSNVPQARQNEPQEADPSKKTFDNFGKSKNTGLPSLGEPQEPEFSRKGGLGKLPALSSMSPQEKFSSSTPQNEFSAGSQAQRKPEDVRKQGDFKKESEVVNKGRAQEEEDLEEYYNEDFDEDLVEEYEEDEEKDKNLHNSSEDVIGASQSQGFDVSVDSLALEEYDYFENANRVR